MSWLAAEEEASLGSGGGGGSGGGSGGTEGQDTLPGLFDRLHARACETVVPPPPVLSRASDHPTTLLGLDGSSNLPTADDETLDLVSQLYFSSYSSVPPQAVGRGLGTGGSGSDLLSFQQSTGQGSVPANTLIDEIYRAKYSKGGMEKRGGESRQREEERGELLLMGEPMEEDSHLLHSL